MKPPFYINTIESVTIHYWEFECFTRPFNEFNYFYADRLGYINFSLKASANEKRNGDVIQNAPFNDIVEYQNINKLTLQFINRTTTIVSIPFINYKGVDYDEYLGLYDIVKNLNQVNYIDELGNLVVSIKGNP